MIAYEFSKAAIVQGFFFMFGAIIAVGFAVVFLLLIVYIYREWQVRVYRKKHNIMEH